MGSSAYDQAFAVLLRLVREDPALSIEFDATRIEFFAGEPLRPGSAQQGRAERRHLEWFLLERFSPRLSGVPIRELSAAFAGFAASVESGAHQALLGSRVGAFEISEPGGQAWARDLSGAGEFLLARADGEPDLQGGDVVVGRIFPAARGDLAAGGEQVYRLSWAAGHFRDGDLRAALRIDFGRVRQTRRGVVRLSQLELEKMFWPENGELLPADPLYEVHRLLQSAGMERTEIDQALQGIRAVDASTYGDGETGDPVLGLLNRLAFESDVDLDAARRALLAWRAGNSADLNDVRRAIADFDRERNAGADLEASFRKLERALDLDPEELAPDASAGDPAPDFPGVVDAMVEEFLWETSRERSPKVASSFDVLRAFGRFTERVGVFENLGRREVIGFLTLALPDANGALGASGARQAVAAVEAFCEWAEACHQVPLLRQAGDALRALRTSLPRIARANRVLADELGKEPFSSNSHGQSAIYEVLETHSDGRTVLRSPTGSETSVTLQPALVLCLQSGDHLKAHATDRGVFDVLCCYPPECAELLAHP